MILLYISNFLQNVEVRRDAQSKEQQFKGSDQQIQDNDQKIKDKNKDIPDKKDQQLQLVQQQVLLAVVQCFNVRFCSHLPFCSVEKKVKQTTRTSVVLFLSSY